MTIASEISKLQTNLTNSYTACTEKGATIPSHQNMDNLPACIVSIEGSTPTLITKEITVNGTYNASADNADGYSSVTVDVSGGGFTTGIPREVSSGIYQVPASSFTFSLPSGVTSIGLNALRYAFTGSTGLTSVNLSGVTTIPNNNSLERMCSGCTSLTSVDLSDLEVVSGNNGMDHAFYGCNNLTSVDLSSLTTVSGQSGMEYTFSTCIGLSAVNLSSLTTVSGQYGLRYTFQGCTSLISVDFSGLVTLSGNQGMTSVLSGCTSLTSVDFSSLEQIGTDSSSANHSHFSNAFYNCNDLTSIFFPELIAIYCTGSSASQGTFYNNNKVQKFYFPKLTTITYGTDAVLASQVACQNIFSSCTSLTELHFGAANQAAIEASPGYSTAWGRGAGNVTIYFDL